MGKTLNQGQEARRQIKSGVDAVANHVGSTLGPNGRTVLIQRDGQSPIITKDGVTVSRNISFDPSLKQAGAEAVKEAAEHTVQKAGDGTTTTCVLAQAIYGRGCNLLDAGFTSAEVRKGIENSVSTIVEEIKKVATPIKVEDESLKHVALVSSNNDEIIASSVVEAYRHVGGNGSISIDRSSNKATYVELGDGCRFNKGYVHQNFSTTSKNTVEFDDCLVYITDKTIANLNDIMPLLSSVSSSQGSDTPLLIIANDVNTEALYTLIRNKLNGNLKVCCVNAPSFINEKEALLKDIAAYVGGSVDSVTSGTPLTKNGQLQEGVVGRAKRVVVTADDTMIIGGYSNKEELEKRINYVLDDMNESKNDVLAMQYYQMRLSILTGKSARIFVGGDSDMEVDERIDRIDDAIKSVKSALEEGVVEGGGNCLHRIAKEHDMSKYVNWFDYLSGKLVIEDEIYEAIKEPLKRILFNAELSYKHIFKKWKCNELGYNVRTQRFENLKETGIIDSAKVVRCALEHAASVACMLLTTDCTIENR